MSQQMQVFFTVLLAAIFLHDVPSLRQSAGMSIGFAGLALIALTLESEFPPLAFGPALAGASSWAVGNVLVKRRTDIPIFPLVVWCSLVLPLPALAVSLAVDPVPDLAAAIARASLTSLGAVLNLGVGTTTVAYAIWGRMPQQHPTGAIAPFALLAPCTGVVASTLVLGEVFSPLRYTGMVLILVGLPVNLTMGGPIRILRSSRAR
jgi:O-acetylserine/cysteine efflux transporter